MYCKFWRKWGTTIDFQKLRVFPFFICFFRKKASKKQPAYSPIIELGFRHPRRKQTKKERKVDSRMLVTLYTRRRAGGGQRPQKNKKQFGTTFKKRSKTKNLKIQKISDVQ